MLLVPCTKSWPGALRGALFCSDTDRNEFLERLRGILQETNTLFNAWDLIPNHFHLLLRAGPVPISTIMRRLPTAHALWFNRRRRRHGNLLLRIKTTFCMKRFNQIVAIQSFGSCAQ
jgi:putative transposase